ncbi:restriction endonuclease subunit S [Azotobacter bryophylli]|uniref:Restriction endonuclease subunit S n=1 Tax=Azotobacter bryophylli TaxID=1986537 RepID=A0ABV7AVH1_9GAMM
MVPEGWKSREFGEVTRIANGQVDPRIEPYSSLPHIGPENIVSDSGQIVDVKLCSELGLISGKYLFDENAIVYSKIRPNLNKVCKPGFSGVCSADMYPIWPKDGVDSGFLFQLMLSQKFVSHAIAVSMRTGMPKINRAELTAIPVNIPPINEQITIAKILATWDQAITTAEQLLASSQQQKKALLQRLLTGKRRFPKFQAGSGYKKTKYGEIPVDWQFTSLASIARQVSKRNIDGKDYPVLSCSKHYGFVNSLDYFSKKVYSTDVSGYKVIERGCFGFPSNHIEEGSIGYQNICDAGIVSPIYIVFKANEQMVDSQFLYALLKTEYYKQIFSAATNASVDRRGSLRWDDFSKIKVQLPSLAEQRSIVRGLSAADREIETLQHQLAGLKKEKKALMQQLLTGKRRVSI